MIKNNNVSVSDTDQSLDDRDKVIEIVNAVNPLPPEIEKMGDEETCCKFCGVSYLIHREVSRLKSQLKNFEEFHQSYLVFYREDKPKLTRQVLDLQNLSRQLQIRVKEMELVCQESIAKQEELVRQIKSANAKIAKKTSKTVAIKSVLHAKMSHIVGDVESVKHLVETLKDSFSVEIQSAKIQLSRYSSLTQEQGSKIRQLEKVNTENMLELSKSREMIQSLNDVLISAKGEKKDMERFLHERQNSITTLTDKLKESRAEISHLETERKALSQQIEDMARIETDLKEELAISKDKQRELMTLVLEDKRKYGNTITSLEEAKRFLERDLRVAEEKLSQQQESMKFQRDIENMSRTKDEQVKSLQEERNRLAHEKRDMILAHQCQVKELQDHFAQKLDTMTRVEDKVAQCRIELLQEQEKALANQKEYLQRKHETETKILHDRIDSLKKDMAIAVSRLSDEKESQRLEMLSNQDKLQELFANERKALNDEISKCNQEKDQLRLSLNKNKMMSMMMMRDDQTATATTTLSTSKGTTTNYDMESLKRTIERKDEEIKLLKGTVRKECEERVELLSRLESLTKNK